MESAGGPQLAPCYHLIAWRVVENGLAQITRKLKPRTNVTLTMRGSQFDGVHWEAVLRKDVLVR